MMFKILLIVLTTTILIKSQLSKAKNDPNSLGSPIDLIESRGFQAKEHSIVTPDGYILSLIEVSNPLMKSLILKEPVLFIHGTLTSSKCFIIYSQGAKPADYSQLNASEMSNEELERLLENDSSKHSLAFLLLNFGHPVWLLNRRGSSYSQNKTNFNSKSRPTNLIQTSVATMNEIVDSPSSLVDLVGNDYNNGEQFEESETKAGGILMRNPISKILKKLAEPMIDFKNSISILDPNGEYWNFSMDEQAKYDLPTIIDFILEKTRNFKKLILVGHSVGAALPIMSMSVNKSFEEKVSKALLWAPSLHLGADLNGNSKLMRQLFYLIQSPLSRYDGPINPSLIVPLLDSLMKIVCGSVQIDTICLKLYDMILGPGGNQQLIEAGFLGAFIDTSSAHELAQLIQSMKFIRTRFYDFNSRKLNSLKYNHHPQHSSTKTTMPPEYDFKTITFKNFSIWWGETDSLVAPEAIELLLKDLSTSQSINFIDKHFFNSTNLFFDHGSFLVHKNVSKLLNIPSLRIIQGA